MAIEAKYYTQKSDGIVLCELCPHQCRIMPDKYGICKVRQNRSGKLYAETYGYLSATHFDPIEKKPLYHFYPGNEIFSLGALGCNFKCACCQNYEISQEGVKGFPRLQEITPELIVKKAKSHPANIGIAYTYNEPFVWFEYMLDIAKTAKTAGLKNVVVSNGYINPAPLDELLTYIDAFNIDLKSFDAKKYKQFTHGELTHVMDTIAAIASREKHLELTMLIVPGLNDDEDQFKLMIKWIANNLGNSIPIHLSRYFPRYKSSEPATPGETLLKLADIAKLELDYVYVGNINMEEHNDTQCPKCKTLLIRRNAYNTYLEGLTSSGECSVCGTSVVKL